MKQSASKLDIQYMVHWILFAAAVMAVIGIVLQVVRYGAVVEPGSIGPAGEQLFSNGY